jgi:O-antigen/teichoic acid export membrane protein
MQPESSPATALTLQMLEWLAAGMCVFMTVAAKVIVRILYGVQFAAAAPLLAVLIWSEIAMFFATVVLNIFIARGEQKLLPIPTIVGAVVNVGLNLILIPRYAALGASWATLVSYTVAWTVALFFFSEGRKAALQGLRYAVPITLVALLATLAGLRFGNAMFTSPLLALGVFASGLWLTGMFGKADMNYLFATVRGSFQKVAS